MGIGQAVKTATNTGCFGKVMFVQLKEVYLHTNRNKFHFGPNSEVIKKNIYLNNRSLLLPQRGSKMAVHYLEKMMARFFA